MRSKAFEGRKIDRRKIKTSNVERNPGMSETPEVNGPAARNIACDGCAPGMR